MPRTVSLVAERAVRMLRKAGEPLNSVHLARALLATNTPSETTARRVLEAAFSGDRRLAYDHGAWHLLPEEETDSPQSPPPVADPDRTLLFVEGGRPGPGEPFQVTSVAALRLNRDEVIAACGGDVSTGPAGNRLRRTILEILDGAVPIIHDPPGALGALESWLGEPLTSPVSVRRLARERLDLPAGHDLENLAARLELPWRETEDPLEMADTLDHCLSRLRRSGESLYELRLSMGGGIPPIDWSRYGFGPGFLRAVPRVPGTYRFYDANEKLIYVGKSKNLNRRLLSYFRETARRSARVQRILDSLHRIEYEAAGSDLEAMLREAESIREGKPEKNVQRRINPREHRTGRPRSILILEPAEVPLVLRAYLIRHGVLLDRIGIGPRGGGLKRIRRVLDDHFFSVPVGPSPVGGPDLDVEVVVRWLAANRDRVVAFDPTELRTSEEVIERLRWFLAQGSPFDPDGAPVRRR